MAPRATGILDTLLHRRILRRWTAAARRAAGADLSQLRADSTQARQLRARLDDVLTIADSRLVMPRIGSSSFPRPGGTDWSWRPNLWRGPVDRKGTVSVDSKTTFGDEVTLFHDCGVPELALRQLRNTREEDLAPFALRMDVFRFDGSFLSVVVDMPGESCQGLRRNHLIRLDMIVETERPLGILARLNIRHGPNTEQIVREMPLHEKDVFVEFDLAYTKLNEKRIERMWVDLILEDPEMNMVTLRDLTFARYPRAEV